MSDIQKQIEQERENAREVCGIDGTDPKCAAAWDAVEELQAERAHQLQTKPKNSLEQFCDDNPDALECRVYDN